MIDFKSAVLSVFLGVVLLNCGGQEPDENAETTEIEFSGPPIENNRNITVADIAGVWQIEATILGPEGESSATDEYNLVITENGRFMDFDFKDDSLAVSQGEAENCYTLRNDGQISKLSNGGFAVDFGLGDRIGVQIYVNYDIQDGLLVAPEHYFFSDSEITVAKHASATMADMEAIFCES